MSAPSRFHLSSSARWAMTLAVSAAGGLVLWIVATAWLAPAIWIISEPWGLVTAWGFHRVFSRTMVLVGFLILLGWAVSKGVRRPADLGLRGPGWGLLGGWGLGVGLVCILSLWATLAGARTWEGWGDLSRMPAFFLSGVAIAFLEEIMFRGLLFFYLLGAMRGGVWWLMPANAAWFAFLHFCKPPAWEGPVGWLDGWTLWGQIFASWGSWLDWMPRAGGLFAVGILLALTVWVTRQLWWAIGLHAGLVTASKTVSHWSEAARGSIERWFGADLVSGWAALICLAFACLPWLIWGYVQPPGFDPPSSSGGISSRRP